MKKIQRILTALFILCCVFLDIFSIPKVRAAETSKVSFPVEAIEDYNKSAELLKIINQKRAEKNLQVLQPDSNLTDFAMQRAAESCIFFAHVRPDGSDLQYLENIAGGQTASTDVWSDWDSSPLHHNTMYDTSADRAGVGCIKYDDSYIWTLVIYNSASINAGSVLGGSNLPIGIRSVTRNVSVVASDIHLLFSSGSFNIEYGDKTNQIPIRIEDICSQTQRPMGYYQIPSDMVVLTSNNPDIFTINSMSTIVPIKQGFGTVTATLKQEPSISNDINVQVIAPYAKKWNIQCKQTYKYTGKQIEPEISIVDGYGNTLQNGKDFSIEVCGDAIGSAGSYVEGKLCIHLLGNYMDGFYEGYSIRYEIQPSNTDITPTEPTTPPVKPVEPETPIVTPGPKPEAPQKPSTPKPESKKTLKVKVSKSSYTYNGKSQKPKVTVYAGSKKLSSKYYSVSYKNNKSVGIATITVKGKGKYKAYSGKATYKIVPRKASLYTPSSKRKGQMSVKWKKDTQTSGFQIQYADSKSFKGAKTYTAKGSTKTSATIKNLKSRKSYYVRVRTYKKVGSKNWYGSWSSTKKVKIK